MLLAYSISGSFDLSNQICKASRQLLVLLLLLIVVSPAALTAQESEDRFASKLKISETQWKRGFHGFNVICMGVDLDHHTLRRFRLTRPDQTVLVMLGDLRTGSLARNPIDLDSYLKKGGSVLIASDSKNADIGGLGFQIEGSGPVAQNPEDFFEGEYNDCPLVTNIQLPIPLLQGIDSLVTNRPGVIRVLPYSGPEWKRIAYLPQLVSSPAGNLFACLLYTSPSPRDRG